MNQLLKKLAVSTSLAVGVAAIATNPAHASTLTGITIGGSAPNDYVVYDVNGNNTVVVPSNLANLQKVLGGDATNPTGNVELAASSELASFNFQNNTSISGKFGNKTLTLSSLTAFDWFGAGLNTTYGADTFATKWFNDFLTKAGGANLVGTATANNAFNLFLGLKGFQRTSDPNISYVYKDDPTGDIKIGLAGHFDLQAYYSRPNSGFAPFARLLPRGFQASEVVKYSLDNQSGFLYSFFATPSGLTTNIGSDTLSHSGNYEVIIKDPKTGTGTDTKVPEPAMILGLLSVAGVFVVKGKSKKVSA
ncbi:MAG TPA: NF038130 family PEP-CTERM protein [Nostocaceae cyanobacterium]|nr:NF038130 family PEP-CTERM protein [Nostocaceae cyanobacterium]